MSKTLLWLAQSWLGAWVPFMLVGCIAVPEPSLDPPDVAIERVYVTDAAGQPWSFEHAPRRPRIVVEGSSPLDESIETRLFHGRLVEAELQGARADTLARTLREREIPLSVAREANSIAVIPNAGLDLGASYTFVVWGAAEFTRELQIASERAGATTIETWPADGTNGVPPAIPLILLRADDQLVDPEEHVALFQTTNARRVRAALRPVACEDVGFEHGHCIALEPQEVLDANTAYELRADEAATDMTGARLEWEGARFRTGRSGDVAALSWSRFPCGLDEVDVSIGCAVVLDDRIAIRTQTSLPARIFMQSAYGQARAVATRGEATLTLRGLPPDTSIMVFLHAIDLAGEVRRDQVELATTTPLALIEISEVQADPQGPEPGQEFVELHNYSGAPIDIQGFSISDEPAKPGDVIERDVVVPPYGYALLVSDRFDPHHVEDVPVPDGTPLIRIGTALGSGGLSNAGETLYLRDAHGRRVSSAPALPAPEPGVCRIRVTEDRRTGENGSFGYDSDHSCSPGGSPSVRGPPP